MHALVLGLFGVVVAVGGAQAETCPITSATITLRDKGTGFLGVTEVERPDLVGRSFEVARYASRRKFEFSKPTGAKKLLGYEGYQLKGAGVSIDVMRDHVDGSPAVTPVSWMTGAKSKYGTIKWGGGRPESVEAGQEIDNFLDGPLSALTAFVSACR